jgi:large subunit ribosomal protein L21
MASNGVYRARIFCYYVSVMQAVISTGNKQYIVSKDQTLEVELLGDAKSLEFDVLMTIDGDKVAVGTPVVKDLKVKAEVLEEVKGEKLKILKFKAKKRVKVLTGHRQHYAKIKIVSIG